MTYFLPFPLHFLARERKTARKKYSQLISCPTFHYVQDKSFEFFASLFPFLFLARKKTLTRGVYPQRLPLLTFPALSLRATKRQRQNEAPTRLLLLGDTSLASVLRSLAMKTSAVTSFLPFSPSFFPPLPSGRQDGSEKNEVVLERDGARHSSLCTNHSTRGPLPFFTRLPDSDLLVICRSFPFFSFRETWTDEWKESIKVRRDSGGWGDGGLKAGPRASSPVIWREKTNGGCPSARCRIYLAFFYAETQGPVPDEAVKPHQRQGGFSRGLGGLSRRPGNWRPSFRLTLHT